MKTCSECKEVLCEECNNCHQKDCEAVVDCHNYFEKLARGN